MLTAPASGVCATFLKVAELMAGAGMFSLGEGCLDGRVDDLVLLTSGIVGGAI